MQVDEKDLRGKQERGEFVREGKVKFGEGMQEGKDREEEGQGGYMRKI